MPTGSGHPCGSCPLRGRTKVRGEGPERGRSKCRSKKALAFLGEAPGAKEVREGKPFVGRSGSLLNLFLEQAGIKRSDCYVTNALLCPIDDKDTLGEEAIREAISCCNRRRQEEGDLNRVGFIIALGGYAGYALTGRMGVQNVRGCIQQSAFGPCLVTYHPAFLVRGRKDSTSRVQADVFAQVVVDDFRHAPAYLAGRRGPKIETVIGPSPGEVAGAVSAIVKGPKFYALDVETDSLNMMEANLNVVGIAYVTKPAVKDSEDAEVKSLVIPWWEGNYSTEELSRIRLTLRRLMSDRRITMVAHNAQYDTTIIERNLGPVDQPIRDTLIYHKAIYPEILHDLQNAVSQFCICHPWKHEFWSRERDREKLRRKYDGALKRWRRTPTDKLKRLLNTANGEYGRAMVDEPRDLCRYNGFDVGYTAALFPILQREVKRAKVERVAVTDSRLGEITRRMTLDGIPLRGAERDGLSRTLRGRLAKAREDLRDLLADIPDPEDDPYARRARRKLVALGPRFNPNSHEHKGLLLDAYGVPCEAVTSTGLRRVRKADLSLHGDNPAVKVLLEYGEADKMLGTFVEGEGLVIDEGGRLHPSWNAHGTATRDPDRYGTVSGRWSSTPNMQNWPKSIRSIVGFEKDDPRVMIQADYSQIELRILALLAGERTLLDAFLDETRDPHSETATALFGRKFTDLEPKGTEWTELRKMAKTSTYAAMYGAGPETMYATIRQDFPDVTLKQVVFIHGRFREIWPDIQDWREEILEHVVKTGEIRTLILGRRRLCPLAGIVEPNASMLWNYPIQGTAADIIGLRVLKLYPLLPESTFLISQIHDAILLEAMADRAEHVAGLVRKYLPWSIRYNGFTMKFPVEVKIGKTWADV